VFFEGNFGGGNLSQKESHTKARRHGVREEIHAKAQRTQRAQSRRIVVLSLFFLEFRCIRIWEFKIPISKPDFHRNLGVKSWFFKQQLCGFVFFV